METFAVAAPHREDGSSRMRPAAMLLILAPIAFVAVVAFTLPSMVSGTLRGGLDELTPQQMATFQLQYIGFHILGLAAGGSGAAGIAALGKALRETKARMWAAIALITGLATLGLQVVLCIGRLTALGFTESTLGQNSTWQWTTWAYVNLGDPGLALATLAGCAALFVSGVLRRTGLVVGILSAIVLILMIVAGFAPFVFAFLWLPLGIGLLRRRTPYAQP